MVQITGLGTPGCGSQHEDLGRIKIVAYTLAHRRFVSTVEKSMRAMIPGIRHQGLTGSVECPILPATLPLSSAEVLAGTLTLSLSPGAADPAVSHGLSRPPLSFAEILPRSRACGQYYLLVYRVLKGPPCFPGLLRGCHMVVSLSGYHGGCNGDGDAGVGK